MTDFQICEWCSVEFDFMSEGKCTEGFIYSCDSCTLSLIKGGK